MTGAERAVIDAAIQWCRWRRITAAGGRPWNTPESILRAYVSKIELGYDEDHTAYRSTDMFEAWKSGAQWLAARVAGEYDFGDDGPEIPGWDDPAAFGAWIEQYDDDDHEVAS